MTNWYNNQRLLCASSNGFGRVFLNTYDLRDRVTNAVDANGVAVAISYDNLSRAQAARCNAGGVLAARAPLPQLITYSRTNIIVLTANATTMLSLAPA